MTTLLLVRHGETFDNVNQVMQGQTQGQLNENGIRQAEVLAEQMASRHIDAFVASDLKRSIDTCVIIAKRHGKEVVTTPLLRERDWGDFTGQFIPDLKDKPWPPNVESLAALKQRASDFLEMIRHDYPGQTVLAVGHGIINKAIQSVFYDKPMNEVLRMTNAEVRVLEL
ncbi:MAG: histidine phosphatase family protein [Prevotella sp.]|nr:histidine phosphatase family protein [Prevotella sp.]